jgi:predicted O-methyltransferase YrrM
MSKLNTGWKNWDKYLGNYKKIPNPNILEIGVFRGEATRWFLTNLCGPKSKIICIDTFEGSPEYPDYKSEQIEADFKKNTSGGPCPVTVMKMLSHDALVKLVHDTTQREVFDIIYVDASHEARDVILDGCLAWKLLSPLGMMIFDDYIWDKIEQEFFRPKMAIDAFIDIMAPELMVVFKSRQVFVQKRKRDQFEKPIPVWELDKLGWS